MELLGKSRGELRALCVEMGESAYRGDQIYRALYAERNFNLAEVCNLPAALRRKLTDCATVTLPAVKQRYLSQDGSVRYLLGLGEKASVEAVFMIMTPINLFIPGLKTTTSVRQLENISKLTFIFLNFRTIVFFFELL